MELCELSGGFLVELEEEQQLQDLLRATAGTEHGRTFWWTSGMDIRSEPLGLLSRSQSSISKYRSKKPGVFVWERSDREVGGGEDLWQNSTSEDVVGQQGGRGHQCVLLGPANNTLNLRLDHADCSEAIARPLCQYLIK